MTKRKRTREEQKQWETNAWLQQRSYAGRQAVDLVDELASLVESIADPDDPDVKRALTEAEQIRSHWDSIVPPAHEDLAAMVARIDARCSWCHERMPVPERAQGGGRSKRFCGTAHRSAYNRWKADPDRYAGPPYLTEDS